MQKHPIHNLIKKLCFSNPDRISAEVSRACTHETYVETLGNAADTLHAGLQGWTSQAIEEEYISLTVREIRKLHLGLCDVFIDITEEDFYGKVKGLWMHPWTGERGVKAHFKFIVCSVKYRNRKYPLAVRMIRIGTDNAKEIGYLLESCKRAGLLIRTVILDRGFYSADVLRELIEQDVFYLVFARRTSLLKNMLDGAIHSVNVEHEMVLNKYKTKTKIPTTIAIVKNVKGHDWLFSTNLDLSGRKIVQRYLMRWNIETDFRVQDEARIKSKSTRPEVRLFYFLISCLLLFVWNATQKFAMPFKKFVILVAEKFCMWNQRLAC